MVQNAWRERNQDLANEFMSEYLYGKHKIQTEEMKLLKEKNILFNEMKEKAIQFAREWKLESNEKAEAQSF